MQIVIDISEELYKNVIEHTEMGYVGSDVWIAVANGTPLPKGHGALIDKDQFERLLRTYGLDYEADTFIPMATTVIEADNNEVD